MKITQYKGDLSSFKKVELSELIQQMQGEEKTTNVRKLRNDLSHCMRGSYCSAVEKVPVVIFSGIFKQKKENKPQITNYNGLVLLEINNLFNLTEAAQIRNLASESLQTLVAFIGSSGKSVKIVVPFTLPDGSLPKTDIQAQLFHARAYRMAVNYYQLQLQREITLKNPLLENGCRLSYDPALYYNPQAVAATMEQPLQQEQEITYQEAKQQLSDPLLRQMPGHERSRIISLLYETSLKKAFELTGIPDEEGDFKAFLIRLAQNCFHSGIPEEDTIKWTFMHTELYKYETEVRVTIHNVYKLGKHFGNRPCIPPVQTLIMQTKEFMQRRFEFRINEITDDVEYRERRSYYFGFFPVTEKVLNSICIKAQEEGLKLWDCDVKRYIYSDNIKPYNPIDDYLDHLPAWDGKDRIRILADTLPTQRPDEWRNQFYIWFLGMVAQWKQFNTEHANSVLPLLVGDQGCGKSTWCRNLMPPALKRYYTDSIDFSNKRNAEMYLHRFALINLDEFDSIGSAQQAFLKYLIQKPEVNNRKPHKSSIHTLKRYATFIATCNAFDLLTDPSGSRRYICIEIKGTIYYTQVIDYEQLYAQAVAALRRGERYWFNHEEEQVITENNKEFQKEPAVLDLFSDYFRKPEAGEVPMRFTASQIIARIKERSGVKLTDSTVMSFSTTLKKRGYKKIHIRDGNFFLVIEMD